MAFQAFEGHELAVRRWWTDRAPEFAAAAKTIAASRPLAHYQSIPHRPQANGIAERSNRLIVEGTRCLLQQAGLGEEWWPLAACHWAACFNATFKDELGETAWYKRHGAAAPFKPYPFGSLVYCLPVKGRSRAPRREVGLETLPGALGRHLSRPRLCVGSLLSDRSAGSHVIDSACAPRGHSTGRGCQVPGRPLLPHAPARWQGRDSSGRGRTSAARQQRVGRLGCRRGRRRARLGEQCAHIRWRRHRRGEPAAARTGRRAPVGGRSRGRIGRRHGHRARG